MNREFAIIGAGRTGRTLGRLLALRGYEPAGLSCRTLRSARLARAFIGGGEPTTSNAQAAARAPLVLIATPDREIAPVARETPGVVDVGRSTGRVMRGVGLAAGV